MEVDVTTHELPSYDEILQGLLVKLREPPQVNGIHANTYAIDASMLIRVVSDLLQLRASVHKDKQQIVQMVTEMTFDTTVSQIANMLDDMAEDFDSDDLRSAADAVHQIKQAVTPEGNNARH